jgi:acetyltransferase
MNSRTTGRSTEQTHSGEGSLGVLCSSQLSASLAPMYYEKHLFTGDGTLVSIRPIKPEDTMLLEDFFSRLTPQAIFYRFLKYLKRLPPEWLEHFTQIDCNRDVALAAVEKSASKDRFLGICRIMRSFGSASGEVAVFVGEPWEKTGLGSALLEECIEIARELGMASLWGLVSTDNIKARTLAIKHGFSVKDYPEVGATELERTL